MLITCHFHSWWFSFMGSHYRSSSGSCWMAAVAIYACYYQENTLLWPWRCPSPPCLKHHSRSPGAHCSSTHLSHTPFTPESSHKRANIRDIPRHFLFFFSIYPPKYNICAYSQRGHSLNTTHFLFVWVISSISRKFVTVMLLPVCLWH